MKTLTTLDPASLDLAFGGASRLASPGQTYQPPARGSSIDIQQLASDFGFQIPSQLAPTFDAISGLVAAGAQTAQSFCGTPDFNSDGAAPALETAEAGCVMDVSGAEPGADVPADAEAPEGPVMTCGNDGMWDEPTNDEAVEPDVTTEAAPAEPAAEIAEPTAATSSGGVLVTSAQPAAAPASGGSWHDIDLLSNDDDDASAAAASAVSTDPWANANDHRAPRAEAVELAAEPASGFQGVVRDHRGR